LFETILLTQEEEEENKAESEGKSFQCDVLRFRVKEIPYLLTPWSRVLLEKLTGSQLVKKFTAFHGTRRFITAFTSACHLSLY
jgi:hypothetical protein